MAANESDRAGVFSNRVVFTVPQFFVETVGDALMEFMLDRPDQFRDPSVDATGGAVTVDWQVGLA